MTKKFKTNHVHIEFYGHKGKCPECGGVVKIPVDKGVLNFENCYCIFCNAVFNMINKPDNEAKWMLEQQRQKDNLFSNDENHPFQKSFDTAAKKRLGLLY